MDKNMISENMVKNMLLTVLNEEISKVKREEFARVQFKIEELQNSLNDTVRELRKLQDSIPSGLKTTMYGRVEGISSNLASTQKLINELKDKIRKYKKAAYSAYIEEKKK